MGLYIISTNILSVYNMLTVIDKIIDNVINEVNATRKGV